MHMPLRVALGSERRHVTDREAAEITTILQSNSSQMSSFTKKRSNHPFRAYVGNHRPAGHIRPATSQLEEQIGNDKNEDATQGRADPPQRLCAKPKKRLFFHES
ncbi:hypothetical protein EVAR_78966_1 [Eumeta japonica]|uniref:Uncharacterized protein n=1 Tax=Eumeta variegata TaxID=151549 RepID=A0A4C1UTF4_EUMVA|nr:hypothetical protein EVAR_78966_1 [Eumeta japonica]